METTVTQRCAECDTELNRDPKSIAAGYAVMAEDNRKVCYNCAAWHEQKHMDENGVMVLYFDEGNKRVVTNWTGTLSYPVSGVVQQRARYSSSGERIRRLDMWIWHNGAWWHGVNGSADNQQCVTFRRLKTNTLTAGRRHYYRAGF